MSADELAFRLGITTNTLYRWERDENSPSMGKLRLVAAHLQVQVSDLMKAPDEAAA